MIPVGTLCLIVGCGENEDDDDVGKCATITHLGGCNNQADYRCDDGWNGLCAAVCQLDLTGRNVGGEFNGICVSRWSHLRPIAGPHATEQTTETLEIRLRVLPLKQRDDGSIPSRPTNERMETMTTRIPLTVPSTGVRTRLISEWERSDRLRREGSIPSGTTKHLPL